MKNTSVTPSATFDQMPSPSQSAKIGASTTRGSALAIFTYGSKTAATRGCCANQKPIRTPAIDPMTKASTDSTSVLHRCFQIVPSTNHLTMRAATSAGVEKKNGGRSFTPPIGTVVKSCQSSTTASATRSWSARSLARDTVGSTSDSRPLRVMAGLDPAIHLLAKKMDPRVKPGGDEQIGELLLTYGFENVPMMPVAPLACPSSALMSSSRVRPGWSAFGSRSVAINVKV